MYEFSITYHSQQPAASKLVTKGKNKLTKLGVKVFADNLIFVNSFCSFRFLFDCFSRGP